MRSSCTWKYGGGHPPCEMFICVYMLQTEINFRRKKKKEREWGEEKRPISLFFLRKSNFLRNQSFAIFHHSSGMDSNIMSIKECFVLLLDLKIFHCPLFQCEGNHECLRGGVHTEVGILRDGPSIKPKTVVLYRLL
ncbi:hypothetical protein VNO78_04169 [Psophocarpus tetragonolobus]|uniref:Uncharacterized protein n=1 Tax=Psophocarpus tetragonolobus TaxID=3891 RepID=A0AAN9TEI7_PSOTE